LATTDDIRTAIDALLDVDMARLIRAARLCLSGTEFQDPNEILNEAVVRALNGSRQWPADRVPFVAFVIMTMRSIADSSREAPAQTRTQYLETMAPEGVGAERALDYLGHSAASFEQDVISAEEDEEVRVRAKTDADRIDAYFESDQDVAWLILCLKEGQTPSHARELAELTMGLTRFSGHLSVYREGVSNGEQRNEVSSGVSQANGRIGLGGPQIRGPVQGVWSNGLDDPKMGQASRARC
jgi:hypothetical protein